jgi:hypothetical protein
VERFNRTLCESLAKITEGKGDWDEFIAPVLFAYRTSKQSSTKFTPFYLVYGHNPTMPYMEMDEIMEGNILDRLYALTQELPTAHETAQGNITKAQRKQKERYDLKVKGNRKYKIGDKVLLYDAARDKHFTGKLKPKWKGPYYIHDNLGNGAFKLRTLDGKLLAAPLNTALLKPYHDRQNWEPTILIEN